MSYDSSIRRRIKLAREEFGWTDFDELLWCDEETVPPWEGRKLHGAHPCECVWHLVPEYKE